MYAAGRCLLAADGSGKNYPSLFSTAPHSGWQKGANAIHTSWQTLPSPTPFPGGSAGANPEGGTTEGGTTEGGSAEGGGDAAPKSDAAADAAAE